MPKLEEALEGLNIKAADVLAWHEYPDRVVVVLISGPKLTWPPAVEPTGAPAPEVKASDEARQAAAELGDEMLHIYCVLSDLSSPSQNPPQACPLRHRGWPQSQSFVVEVLDLLMSSLGSTH